MVLQNLEARLSRAFKLLLNFGRSEFSMTKGWQRPDISYKRGERGRGGGRGAKKRNKRKGEVWKEKERWRDQRGTLEADGYIIMCAVNLALYNSIYAYFEYTVQCTLTFTAKSLHTFRTLHC